MKYCAKCRTPMDGSICPECGCSNSVIAKPQDLVFLAECDAFSADILEGMLEQKNIEVTKNINFSEYSPDGLQVVSCGTDKLYVRSDCHAEAMKVIQMLYNN